MAPVGAVPGRGARGGVAQFWGGGGGGVLQARTLPDLGWCPCGVQELVELAVIADFSRARIVPWMPHLNPLNSLKTSSLYTKMEGLWIWCTIAGIVFAATGPLTLVELLKICLSRWLWRKFGVCFSPEFCCAEGACRHPDSSGLLGETSSLQVSDFCPKGMTSFWPFTQNLLLMSCLAEEGGLTVKLEISVHPFLNTGENWPGEQLPRSPFLN